MNKIYRLYIIGETPPSLIDQISAIHAKAVLASQNENGRIPKRQVAREQKTIRALERTSKAHQSKSA